MLSIAPTTRGAVMNASPETRYLAPTGIDRMSTRPSPR